MDDSLFDDQERSGNEPFAPFDTEMMSEQHHISFDGDELLLVLLPPHLYFSLPSLCTALTINTRGQLQRIQRTPELEAGLRQLPLRTRGGTQRINCLLLEKIVPWLAGVQTRGMDQRSLNKLERYLAGVVTAATSIIADYEPTDLPRQTILPFLDGDLEQSLALPTLAPDIDQEDLRTVLTNIPYLSSSAMLITTNYQEDRAIREATLARKVEWEEEPGYHRMRYIASNALHVYLGDPEHPLSLAEALQRIRSLGETTILTARILLGLWNIRRSENQLTK